MKLLLAQQALLFALLFILGACSSGVMTQGSKNYSSWSKERHVKHVENVLAHHDKY